MRVARKCERARIADVACGVSLTHRSRLRSRSPLCPIVPAVRTAYAERTGGRLMPDRPRLLIASNRLPFAVQCGADGLELTPTTGGLASALSAVHQRGDHVWVGWPGECPAADEYTRAELIGRLHARRVVPVSLSADEVSGYYDGEIGRA